MNMAKKFKELKRGDKIYCFDKREPRDGIKELTLKYPPTLITGCKPELVQILCKETISCIFIPKYRFGKDTYSSLYYIHSTSKRELIRASEKFIIRETEKVEKHIKQKKEEIKYLEETLEKLGELLIVDYED